MIRVAVVEDDADLLDEVAFNLRRQGFEVAACTSGETLDAILRTQSFDIAVLDIGLPGEDGFSIARRLRRDYPGCGIVMLTARSEVENRILGLEEGADAYLAKPADFRELALVIRALLRRLGSTASSAGARLVVDERAQLLRLADGAQVELTRSETLLLSRLARAPGQQATREQLIEALGGCYADYDPRRLEAVVSRLRRKLAQQGIDAHALQAVRQAGYLFTLPLIERAIGV
jgi:DNA-binding response OmpR family regulator